MADTIAAAETGVNPRGIFRRDTKGQGHAPVTVQADRSQIRFFAQVLGFTDPIHFDVEAARAAGHPDLVAPPSFFVVLEADAAGQLEQRGEAGINQLVNCDLRYLLHGSERYDYTGLIYAGDELTVSGSVIDFYDKKGGAMEFAELETRITHSERGVIVRGTRTLLHRLA